MSNQANGLYEFGSYRLDAAKRLLTRSGEIISLAPKTFDLLLLLIGGQGRVLTKAELMTALWPDTFVEEASLSYQVATLRKALGSDGEDWIETVPKHGYRFTAAITTRAGDGDPLDSRAEATRSVPSDAIRSRLRHHIPWGVVVLATVTGLLLGFLLKNRTLPTQPSIRFLVSSPESGESFGFHSLSPDGRWLAFTTGRRGATGGGLWVRRLDSTKVGADCPWRT